MKNGVKAIFYLLLFLVSPVWSSEQASSSSMEDVRTSGQKRKRTQSETEQVEKKTKKEALPEKEFTIGVLGATGKVGEITSFVIQDKKIADELILWGRNDALCAGIVEDLKDVSEIPISSETDIQKIARADLIIITVGEKVTKNQPRDELFKANMEIIRTLITNLSSSSERNDNAVILVVTNPVEDLTQFTISLCQKYNYLHNPQLQVIGTGTLLDQLRALNISRLKRNNITVLGEHGDALFIPWSLTTDTEHLSTTEKDAITEKTKKRSYIIVATKGFTQYGIAQCIIDICNALRYGNILPVSAWDPQYEIVLSRPIRLSKTGITEIIPLMLNSQEQEKLERCIKKRKEAIKAMSI